MVEASLLATASIFNDLSDEQYQILVPYVGSVTLGEGELLFNEGEMGNQLCFVISGELEVIKQSMQGESVVINTLNTGDTVGEMSIIDELPRSATIKSKTSAKLAILTKENFKEISEKHPKISINILKNIARKLSLHLRRSSAYIADTKSL